MLRSVVRARVRVRVVVDQLESEFVIPVFFHGFSIAWQGETFVGTRWQCQCGRPIHSALVVGGMFIGAYVQNGIIR